MKEKFTALYERLSHDDELQGESNSESKSILWTQKVELFSPCIIHAERSAA